MENCIPHRFWAQAENRGRRITTGSWENNTFYMFRKTKECDSRKVGTVSCNLLQCFKDSQFLEAVANILVYTASGSLAVFSNSHIICFLVFWFNRISVFLGEQLGPKWCKNSADESRNHRSGNISDKKDNSHLLYSWLNDTNSFF